MEHKRAGWDDYGLQIIPPCVAVRRDPKVPVSRDCWSWLFVQCFECLVCKVSGTVSPLEVFSLAAIRRSLACFPMICSMIVFLYKIIIYYQKICNYVQSSDDGVFDIRVEDSTRCNHPFIGSFIIMVRIHMHHDMFDIREFPFQSKMDILCNPVPIFYGYAAVH